MSDAKLLKKFEVGQIVQLNKSHPWGGQRGEIVGLDMLTLLDRRGFRVYLFDVNQEVYITRPEDAKVLEDGNCRYT